MSTEITSTKIVTPAGDSHSERKMILDKRSFYQNPFFIIASSLLALLVLVTATSQNGDQYLRTDVAASMSGNEDHKHCSQGPGASVPGLGVDGNAGSSEYCHDSGQCRVYCCDDTSPNFTKPNCCMCASYCEEYCQKIGPHCRGCPNPGPSPI